MTETHTDPSTWFDPVGTCRCGKPATGFLRGDRNQSMGPYCRKCADKRIKDANKARENVKLAVRKHNEDCELRGGGPCYCDQREGEGHEG